MSHSTSQTRRRSFRDQSPAESSSDELAAGSDHDEAERRRASWTQQKGFTPQRPQNSGRHYSKSESPDELAVDAGEYWRRSSRISGRGRSQSPRSRSRSRGDSRRGSNSPDDDDMSGPDTEDRATDEWIEHSDPDPPTFLLRPDHVNYKEKFVLRGHLRGVSQVQFSPDGTMIASAGMFDWVGQWIQRLTLMTGADAALKIWDTASGRLIHTFEGHLAGISTLAWAPNGKWVATGSDDKTIRFWNVRTVSFPSLLPLFKGPLLIPI